jgi:ketosteroid isomerase-like protein
MMCNTERLHCGWVVAALAGSVWLLAGTPVAGAETPDEELGAVEKAFAATMADRDPEAFASYLDDEVVFFTGPTELRGRQAVVDAWAPYFEGDDPPFSWRPEVVSVLDSGSLGLTSGPVDDPEGNRVGSFNSIWRKNEDGAWKIIFDRGCP